ncbi:unnamed protein product [Spirodela intermedia]|uniref:Cupin type-1 domain-containing protein n=1 Tax=Spirodela intermedia TaxID=51605 RepID=A0ABN7ECJ7_SPIIN|nr:unnamed protein product [Spirodela intermedia]
MATRSGLSLLSSAVCVLLLSQGCLGQLPFGEGRQPRRQTERREWRLERLEAVEPSRRIQAEAGVIEYWDQNQEQFQLAGVAAYRTTIEPKGLLLPYYSNAPRLVYIIQGNGVTSSVFPGCPETFQSFQQSEPREEERRERAFVISTKDSPVPGGRRHRSAGRRGHWFYNDGETPVVAVTVADSGNNANQLDQTLRRFELAGSPERRESSEGEEAFSGNVFRGLNVDVLAEAFGVSRETIRKLQGHDDRRFVRPERRQERQEEEEEEEERRRRRTRGTNGLEEVLCNLRNRENIRNPDRADVYSREAGSVTSLNSQKLPILRFLRLSHPLRHQGRARLQISGNQGREASFDREVRRGQIVVIPQNFVWVSFKTEDFPLVSPLAGKASVFRGLPEGVIVNSYRLSDEEARRVKHGRGEEFLVFRPRRKVVESPLLERAAEDLAVLIRPESAPFVVVFLVRNKNSITGDASLVLNLCLPFPVVMIGERLNL